MDRSETLTTLRAHEAAFRRLGVDGLYLFGSTARAETHADSDVDLFFDYRRGWFGLYELIDVKDISATILGCRADVMSRDSLHPALRSAIEASAIRVF